MKKNIQFKIILMIAILGILLITALGLCTCQILASLSNTQIETTEQIIIYNANIKIQVQNMQIFTIIADVLFGAVCIVVGIFMSKVIVNPITKLINSAPKMANGENIEINRNKVSKTEIEELTDAFGVMTNEWKENIEEVNRQKKQMETILLHMTDGIVAFNMNGEIMQINPAAINLLGLTEKDNTFEKIFGKLNIDINLEKTVYLENWTSSEQRVNIGDKYLNIFFASFKDNNESPSGIMVVVQDITEHVKLDNMRKEFVADVSHELKTPITSIMGYADTLLEGEYDKETQDRFLGVISSEARRMANLVKDLLDLSRYDNNKNKHERIQFNLGELVKKCQEKLQLEINKKEHQIECFVTANVPLVYADKEGVERVVLNILSNSIKYTPQKGNIKLYVGFVYNDAYIKVIDNGIGIPEEDLSRIFDRFYRVDKARTRELGGTGLGLSIAKEILNQNQGSIDIKSIVGKGTEVVMRIPTKK